MHPLGAPAVADAPLVLLDALRAAAAATAFGATNMLLIMITLMLWYLVSKGSRCMQRRRRKRDGVVQMEAPAEDLQVDVDLDLAGPCPHGPRACALCDRAGFWRAGRRRHGPRRGWRRRARARRKRLALLRSRCSRSRDELGDDLFDACVDRLDDFCVNGGAAHDVAAGAYVDWESGAFVQFEEAVPCRREFVEGRGDEHPVQILLLMALLFAQFLRASRPCMWHRSRKDANREVHAEHGNGPGDGVFFDRCWAAYEAHLQLACAKTVFKRHCALLKMDSVWAGRVSAAGNDLKRISTLLAGAAKKHELGWKSVPGLMPRPTPVVGVNEVSEFDDDWELATGRKLRRKRAAEHRAAAAVPKVSSTASTAHPASACNAGAPQRCEGMGPDRGDPVPGREVEASPRRRRWGWTKPEVKLPKEVVQFTLAQDDWETPVVARLQPGVPGVTWAVNREEADAFAKAVVETSTPAGVVSVMKWADFSRAPPQQVVCKLLETRKRPDGVAESKTTVTPAWLYQVGRGLVSARALKPSVTRALPSAATTVVAMRVAKKFLDDKSWAAIVAGKVTTLARLAKEALAKTDEGDLDLVGCVLDTFRLVREGDGAASCLLRVKTAAFQRILAKSGTGGAFFSPLASERGGFEVIWMRTDKWDLDGARGSAKSLHGACGLVLGTEGLGIRVAKNLIDAARSSLGRPAPRQSFRVHGLPVDYGPEEVVTLIQDALSFLVECRTGTRRQDSFGASWLLEADQAPPQDKFSIQIGEEVRVLYFSVADGKRVRSKQMVWGPVRGDQVSDHTKGRFGQPEEVLFPPLPPPGGRGGPAPFHGPLSGMTGDTVSAIGELGAVVAANERPPKRPCAAQSLIDGDTEMVVAASPTPRLTGASRPAAGSELLAPMAARVGRLELAVEQLSVGMAQVLAALAQLTPAVAPASALPGPAACLTPRVRSELGKLDRLVTYFEVGVADSLSSERHKEIILVTPKDGNCQFHAVVEGMLRLDPSCGLNHLSLREQVCATAKSSLVWQQRLGARLQDWNMWLQGISTPGTWGDEHSMEVIASLLPCCIVILHRPRGMWVWIAVDDQVQRNDVVVLDYDGGHYVALAFSAQERAEVLQRCQAAQQHSVGLEATFGLSGGGDDRGLEIRSLNLSSLRRHWRQLVGHPGVVWALQEVRCTRAQQRRLEAQLGDVDLDVAWGKAAQVVCRHGGAGPAATVWASSKGGVAIVSPRGLAAVPIPPSGPLERALFETGRWVQVQLPVVLSSKGPSRSPACVLRVFSLYGHSNARRDASFQANERLLRDAFDAASVYGNIPLMLCGDFNVRRGESAVLEAALATGVWADIEFVGSGGIVPTLRRAGVTSRIDMILCNKAAAALCVESRVMSEVHISDHAPVMARLSCSPSLLSAQRFRSVRRWEADVGAVPKVLLEEVDAQVWPAELPGCSVLQSHPVQQAWLDWSGRAECALRAVSQLAGAPDPKRGRGKLPPVVRVPVHGTSGRGVSCGQISVRCARLLRTQRRVRELGHRIRRGAVVVDVGGSVNGLRKDILREATRLLGQEAVLADADACRDLDQLLQRAVEEEAGQLKAERLRAWRESMRADFRRSRRAAFRYVRGDPAQPLRALLTAEGVVTEPCRVHAALVRDWASVFRRYEYGDPRPVWEEVRALVGPHLPSAPCAVVDITAEDVMQAVGAMASESGGGVDGWQPKDLKALGVRAYTALARVLNLVEETRRWPDSTCVALVTGIPKKTNAGARDLRCITVFSVLFRVWAAIRFRHLAAWQAVVVGPQAAGGIRHRSARAITTPFLLEVEKALLSKAPLFGLLLDDRKAFDLLDHDVVYGLWQMAGLPERISCAHRAMSLLLVRHFKVQGHVGNPWQAQNGFPQGDALAIVAENVVVAAWNWYVLAEVQKASLSVALYSYVDDKSAVATQLRALQVVVAATDRIASAIGVKFNVDKSWCFALQHAGPIELCLQGERLPLKCYGEVLGVAVNLTRRRVLTVQNRRAADATQVAFRARALPIHVDGLEQLIGASAVAKYRWGIEAGLANAHAHAILQTAVLSPFWKRGSNRIPELAVTVAHRAPAIDLRMAAVLECFVTVRRFVACGPAASELWAEVWRLRDLELFTSCPTGIAFEMRRWLQVLGWHATSPLQLVTHDGSLLHLVDSPRGLFDHVVREAVRRSHWVCLATRRPEFADLPDKFDLHTTCALLREPIKKRSLSGYQRGVLRRILCDAVILQDRVSHRDGNGSSACLLCGVDREDVSHVYWACPSFADVRGRHLAKLDLSRRELDALPVVTRFYGHALFSEHELQRPRGLAPNAAEKEIAAQRGCLIMGLQRMYVDILECRAAKLREVAATTRMPIEASTGRDRAPRPQEDVPFARCCDLDFPSFPWGWHPSRPGRLGCRLEKAGLVFRRGPRNAFCWGEEWFDVLQDWLAGALWDLDALDQAPSTRSLGISFVELAVNLEAFAGRPLPPAGGASLMFPCALGLEAKAKVFRSMLATVARLADGAWDAVWSRLGHVYSLKGLGHEHPATGLRIRCQLLPPAEAVLRSFAGHLHGDFRRFLQKNCVSAEQRKALNLHSAMLAWDPGLHRQCVESEMQGGQSGLPVVVLGPWAAVVPEVRPAVLPAVAHTGWSSRRRLKGKQPAPPWHRLLAVPPDAARRVLAPARSVFSSGRTSEERKRLVKLVRAGVASAGQAARLATLESEARAQLGAVPASTVAAGHDAWRRGLELGAARRRAAKRVHWNATALAEGRHLVAPSEASERVFCLACAASMKAGAGSPFSRLRCLASAAVRRDAAARLAALEVELVDRLDHLEVTRTRGSRVDVSQTLLGRARGGGAREV